MKKANTQLDILVKEQLLPILTDEVAYTVRMLYPEFVQPTSTETAYMKDDKITFNGAKYISLVDYNVYSQQIIQIIGN